MRVRGEAKANKNNLLRLDWTSPFALRRVLNCSVERDVWGKLTSCDFTAPALVMSNRKKRRNALASDMPDAVSARLAAADRISHYSPCWCRSPWINVLWVSQPRPTRPIRGETLNTQDLARGLKPWLGFVAAVRAEKPKPREVTSLKVNPECFAAIFSAKFSLSCFRLHQANSQQRHSLMKPLKQAEHY